MKGFACFLLAVAAGTALSPAQTAPRGESACVTCHRDADLFDDEHLTMVRLMLEDVHAESGLSCHDCHGGNPDPKLATDPEGSMNPNYAPNPFRAQPERTEIPAYCGRCHSNPVYMKRFRPDVRVDQESEYWTSQHGIALRAGDAGAANCVDCHHAHGILRPANPRSPVYPTHVADTCANCHADAARMEGRKTPDGRPLPLDQAARWRRSVHAEALLVKEDLTAPTCNDCHGNHGAAPPGLESIIFVCGQCHGREASLFRKSAKHDGWQLHNEYLEEVAPERCAACHDSGPAAQVNHVGHFGECTTCHGNHGIVRPTVALFAPLPPTPCDFCHERELAEEIQETPAKRRSFAEQKESLLRDAKGLEGDALFDYMVDMALQLAPHRLPGLREDGQPELRPEFAKLFDKFRIGKTYYLYKDPASGEEKRQPLVRCTNCHDVSPGNGGVLSGQDFLERMRQLTTETATAERILLSARRGGIETRDALLAVDRAVDAQIALEALIHTFTVEGAYAEKQQEGIEHAEEALAAGRQARAELASRRSGLIVTLVLIGLVLVGLALKIRQLSAAGQS